MPANTMMALAVTELGKKAELREMPRPRLEDDTVVIKTRYSGVSIGTEMWMATGQRQDYGPPPFINGYQATGEIAEIGQGVSGLQPGDLVAVFGRGAHAPFVKAKKDLVHKLPEAGADLVSACFVMPCVGSHALNHAGVNTGDIVLVVGQGLIGQCTAQLAQLRGAYVIASEKSPARLALARQYCADWVIDAARGKVSAQLKERFPGGVDVVIESTGFTELIDDAMECVRAASSPADPGRFVFEGWYPGNLAYNMHIPHEKQVHAFYPAFIGSRPNREGILRLLASGRFKMKPLISHVVPWRESAALYNRLFTPARNEFNGIVFAWTD